MPLTIKKEHNNPAKKFGLLTYGELFLLDNHLCIKALVEPEHEDSYDAAIQLADGRELSITDNRMVVPVNATLTYSIQ